ncbi:hypothetical protein TNCV_4073131 [Trichonephila clavipes]|uniref:Uncharacterized protein n=1 Tax=Trichonephila clavipes TaxID=2585209 RepID=A0A8X7BG29_TRICX|nr:hypothetical protein TNCV_4073131 [Trichonephila clavipes]
MIENSEICIEWYHHTWHLDIECKRFWMSWWRTAERAASPRSQYILACWQTQSFSNHRPNVLKRLRIKRMGSLRLQCNPVYEEDLNIAFPVFPLLECGLKHPLKVKENNRHENLKHISWNEYQILCSFGKKCYGGLRNFEACVRLVIHYLERKLLSGIDVSEKARKVSKSTNALGVRRLPVPLETSKRFLRYIKIGFKQQQNELGYPRPNVNGY